jgi:hypothetical protein
MKAVQAMRSDNYCHISVYLEKKVKLEECAESHNHKLILGESRVVQAKILDES